MSDDLVKQCIEELQDLVQCRCHDAYKGRGLHDPTCCCDYAEALKTVADRIEELELKLAKALGCRKAIEDLHEIEAGDMSTFEAIDNIRTTIAELKGQDDE